MSLPIDFRETLVCDDIRREDNGKAIIVGVYSGDIIASSFPSDMRVSFWLQGRPTQQINEKQQMKLELRLLYQDETPGTKVDIDAMIEPSGTVPEGASVVLVLSSVPIHLEKPCKLLLSIQDNEQKWITLAEKRVFQGQP